MLQLKELFKNSDKALLAATEAAEKERGRSAKEVYEIANRCYESDDFKRYRNAHEYSEKLHIAAVLNYSNPDPIQYAFVIQRYIVKINEMRFLRNEIETDLRRKAKQA